jgi:hypothetical protein
MIRVLEFKKGIIEGELVREVQEVFPETKDSFEQRKTYDEYYYKQTKVYVDIERVEQLNKQWNVAVISSNEIIIDG